MKRLFLISIFVLFLVMATTGCSQAEVAPIVKEVIEQVEVTKEVEVEVEVLKLKLDEQPRMAVVSAFDSELALLLSWADISETYVLGGHTYHVGTLAGNDVVMFLSGVSMVNAATYTQIAVDRFNIERIVFSGIAGGVNNALHIGDVTVPAAWGQYMENYLARETEPGVFTLPIWVTPAFPNYGMMYPGPVSVTSLDSPADTPSEMFWFPVDEDMLALAYQLEGFDLANCTPEDACLTYDPVVKVGGNGVSGQSFVDNAEFREYAWTTFQADALDMETAAVAQVAYINNVPYIAFRSLSDLAGGGEGENEIGTFFGLAADNSAHLVMTFLEAWSSGIIPDLPEKEQAVGQTEPTEMEPLTFGVVLVGPKNDHGWSQAHYEGGLYVEENLPGAKMIVFESLNPADKPEATLEGVVDEMVAQGAKLVITTSDEFEEDTVGVAEKYPDVVFINASGDDALTGEAPTNLGNIMGRMEDMKAVAGCAAALATETGELGYLGPLINFETRRLAASAYLGARYCFENYRDMNPNDLEFTVTWIGFWFNIPGVTLDPTEVVTSFFDSGVDVVMSGIDTTEGIDVAGQHAARSEKVWSVAYDYAGGCANAPEICLGVPYFNWGPAYLETAQSVVDGTWTQSWDWNPPNWENLTDNTITAVGWVDGSALTGDMAANLHDFILKLASGETNVWIGPIVLQDGSEYVPAGSVASDHEIWYLPQLLQGMTGPSE